MIVKKSSPYCHYLVLVFTMSCQMPHVLLKILEKSAKIKLNFTFIVIFNIF